MQGIRIHPIRVLLVLDHDPEGTRQRNGDDCPPDIDVKS